MNCKQAKTHVALLIGNDLEPTALQDVRNHLGQCAGCRQHFERLSSCLEVLQAPPRAWNSEEESLWPKLSVRLASPNAGQKPHRLSGWAPTLAVAAACTAMFWVASSRWSADRPVDQPIFNGTELQPQSIGETPDDGNSPEQRGAGAEARPRRGLHNPPGRESSIIPYRGSRPAMIPAIPVVEPAH